MFSLAKITDEPVFQRVCRCVPPGGGARARSAAVRHREDVPAARHVRQLRQSTPAGDHHRRHDDDDDNGRRRRRRRWRRLLAAAGAAAAARASEQHDRLALPRSRSRPALPRRSRDARSPRRRVAVVVDPGWGRAWKGKGRGGVVRGGQGRRTAGGTDE